MFCAKGYSDSTIGQLNVLQLLERQSTLSFNMFLPQYLGYNLSATGRLISTIPSQVNDGNAGILAMKTLSKGDYMLFRKNRGQNTQFAAIKAKTSLEVDVLDKTVKAVDNKDGNHYFIFPS